MSDSRSLPEMLRLVIGELGLPAAMHLVETIGGERVSVPEKAEGSALARRVGPDIAHVLSKHYAPLQVYVPNWRSREQHLREALVQDNPDASANELVRMTGLSERQVRRIRSRQRDSDHAGGQLPLFGE